MATIVSQFGEKITIPASIPTTLGTLSDVSVSPTSQLTTQVAQGASLRTFDGGVTWEPDTHEYFFANYSSGDYVFETQVPHLAVIYTNDSSWSKFGLKNTEGNSTYVRINSEYWSETDNTVGTEIRGHVIVAGSRTRFFLKTVALTVNEGDVEYSHVRIAKSLSGFAFGDYYEAQITCSRRVNSLYVSVRRLR